VVAAPTQRQVDASADHHCYQDKSVLRLIDGRKRPIFHPIGATGEPTTRKNHPKTILLDGDVRAPSS
jgi:hypothetical protein